MANSKFILTFTEMPSVNQIIRITETSLSTNLSETFKANRLGMFQTKIPPQYNIGDEEFGELLVYSGFISDNYKNAFNLDYNSSNLFTVTSVNGDVGTGLGTVTVEANYPGAFFLIATNTAGVDVEIINEEEASPIEIDAVTFLPADSLPCKNVKVLVSTTALATRILSPFVLNDNTANPFNFTTLRDQMINILVENAEGNQDNVSVRTPRALDASNFQVQVNNSPNGATVIVLSENSEGLDLEYSLEGGLDEDAWQTSNVFSGLEPDSYTLYVRDQLGCSFTIDFLVSETNINTPHFYISKSNSIRFAQRIEFGDAANYKNDENTLSCEVEVDIPYHEVQLFQTADTVTTQFQSNYGTNEVTVIKEDLTEVSVPVLQKTNFIGIKDKRDARKYNLGDGKVGIYFTNGNVYNYDTNAVTGTHALAGLLPEWGLSGNYINIAGSWFLIESIVFDESKNADVIIISETYAGADVEVVVGCVYNIYPYEIYEASIDMSDYIGESIRVRIDCTDENFPSLEHLSEEINVEVRHQYALDINYWNDDNNDVFYATGIRHRIRIPYTKIEGISDGDSAIHKTDVSTILLSAELYEGKKFIFEPCTEEIWRKLMMALSHKNVFIDGVRYVKSGDFETEGPLEQSNLYVLKATMLKGGGVYNSDGSTFGAGNASNAEIPGFIEGNDGFIAY